MLRWRLPTFAAAGTLAALGLGLATVPGTDAAFPGEPGKIVFDKGPASLPEKGDTDLWTMNPDGSHLQRLTSGKASDEDAFWSPDGRSVAFQSNRAGRMDIWVLDVQTKALRRLTSMPGDEYMPSWSPDGSEIVFSNMNSIGEAIFEIGADGKGLKRMTPRGRQNFAPVFSPDGKRIVWTRGGKVDDDIWVMNATGGPGRPLVRGPGDQMQPNFSPDDKLITYVDNSGGDGEVMVASDVNRPVALTHNHSEEYGSTFSPDGGEIVYTSCHNPTPKHPNGNCDVLSVSVQRRIVRKVAATSGFEGRPNWQALPGETVGATGASGPTGPTGPTR